MTPEEVVEPPVNIYSFKALLHVVHTVIGSGSINHFQCLTLDLCLIPSERRFGVLDTSLWCFPETSCQVTSRVKADTFDAFDSNQRWLITSHSDALPFMCRIACRLTQTLSNTILKVVNLSAEIFEISASTCLFNLAFIPFKSAASLYLTSLSLIFIYLNKTRLI